MNLMAVCLVFLSALMHATWHTLLKIGEERYLTYSIISTVAIFPAIVALLIFDNIFDLSLKHLTISLVLHSLYKVLLCEGYRFNFGQIYPIARGVAPILVVFLSMIFSDDIVSALQIVAIILISIGVYLLGFKFGKLGKRGVLFALFIALVTACYTIVDGLGARTAGNPLIFIAWLYILDGIPFTLIVAYIKRKKVVSFVQNNWKPSAMAGIFTIVSYALVVYSMTLINIGTVAALREVSIIFAGIIGTVFLKEPFGKGRIRASFLIATGVVILVTSPQL